MSGDPRFVDSEQIAALGRTRDGALRNTMETISLIFNAIAPRSALRVSGLALLILLAGTASANIGVDQTAVKDQATASTTVATAPFPTTSSNELLLAFVSTDSVSGSNTTVTGISGGGLTWVLVVRTNAQRGTAEIWRAFSSSPLSSITVTATLSQSVVSSMTVMSFTGVNTSGTNGSGAIGATNSANSGSGAPSATLVTTQSNSLVLGVGNDYDNAIARTLGTNQTLVHQDLAPVGDTYWVQMENAPTPLSGTSVTINDTAPTTDRYNLSIVEVLPNLNVSPTPDLTISKSHSGNFIQGQIGATYTITVTNIGSAATSGTVRMTDTLPTSLTPTAISGANWNCTLSPLTCTRSDALAAAASYPAITVTVNVASNAPGSVTNTATVSGGGETNTSNDLANDVTTIVGPPARVAATAGTSQSTTINTAFGTLLQATVTDANNNPVSGVTVTFTAPSSGASGTFGGGIKTAITDSLGVATAAQFTANGVVGGPYAVTANVSGLTPTSFSLTNNPLPPLSGSDWLTYGHDPQRSGNAAGESAITTTSVKNLVLKWSAVLDGKVTAQLLFVSATVVGGQTRDVVVAATAANSLYALDAATGTQLWRTNFGPASGSTVVPGGIGISASPVIDRNRNLIYTVSDDGRLHTLRLADGTEATSALPVILDSLNPPVLSNTLTNVVWGGLTLVGGNLYITTASDGNDTNPWWGRIVRVDVSGAAPVIAGLFKVVPSIAAPNGGGGIWGYGGVSADSLGRIFAATAADSKPYTSTVPEGYTPYAGRMVALAADLGYSATTSPLGSPLGSYEPPHPSPCPGAPGVCDMDFGATPIIIQPSSCPAALTGAVNKDGHIYLLPTDDLAASNTTSLQGLALNNAFDGPGAGGLTGVPAYWPTGSMMFVTDGGPGINGISAGVVGLTVDCNAPPTYLHVAWSVPLAAADNQPPSSPTVANGVVFVGSGINGSIHAYDATTGSELWNSGNAIASGATFAAPMVASGSLYVATWNGFNTGDGGTVRSFVPGSSPPPPPPSSGVLLGDQALESVVDSNPLGNSEAFQATATASGTVSKLSIYVDASSTAKTMVVGIYADSSGHPGALIAQGSSSQLTAGAWNSIPIPGAIVSAGTPYWIAILGTQSGRLSYRDGSAACVSETSGQTNLTALPSTWVTGQVWPSCPLSGYGSSGP
jgi:outer membrane protein assembly factor BamB